MASAGTGPKFYDDDPISVEPETQDASRVVPWKIDLFYDLLLNQFAQSGRTRGPAREKYQYYRRSARIPAGSPIAFLPGRSALRRPSAVRSPPTDPPRVNGQLSAPRPRATPLVSRFVTAPGTTWFLAFDPKSNPEGATAAAVIAMRIFWTLGYFQAEYHISEFRREQLEVDPKAKFEPVSGKERPMKLKDIEPDLDRAARKPDGAYRVLASRLLPGTILGGFKYFGTRPDDPNDIVPHEHRRELRALKVFAAWTNLVDLKALNTMDTLITENGKARVRHYLLDVGSTFGMGANGPREWTEGYENLYEGDKTMKRLVSFGFYLQPWQTVDYEEHPAIGRFEGKEFDPREVEEPRPHGRDAAGARRRRFLGRAPGDGLQRRYDPGHGQDRPVQRPGGRKASGGCAHSAAEQDRPGLLDAHQSPGEFFPRRVRCPELRKRRGEDGCGPTGGFNHGFLADL